MGCGTCETRDTYGTCGACGTCDTCGTCQVHGTWRTCGTSGILGTCVTCGTSGTCETRDACGICAACVALWGLRHLCELWGWWELFDFCDLRDPWDLRDQWKHKDLWSLHSAPTIPQKRRMKKKRLTKLLQLMLGGPRAMPSRGCSRSRTLVMRRRSRVVGAFSDGALAPPPRQRNGATHGMDDGMNAGMNSV